MSNINYLNINENFPIEGQDNDTQVFRDNFDSIKTALRVAKEEIGSLEDFTLKKGEDNDFALGIIRNAVLQTPIDKKYESVWDGDEAVYDSNANILTFNFNNGPYQIYTLKSGAIDGLAFENFPGDTIGSEGIGVGKILVELYSDVDGAPRVLTFPDINDSSVIIYKKNNFSESIIVDSLTDPVFIEIWKNENTVYVNYLGKFSSTPPTTSALPVPNLSGDGIDDLEVANLTSPGTITAGMLVYDSTTNQLKVCVDNGLGTLTFKTITVV